MFPLALDGRRPDDEETDMDGDDVAEEVLALAPGVRGKGLAARPPRTEGVLCLVDSTANAQLAQANEESNAEGRTDSGCRCR